MTMNCIASFQQKLEDHLGKKLKLKINDNRSTMLSVRWEPDCTKVSMHRMFLKASQNVMQALACYLKEEKTSVPTIIKAFIEEGVKNLDYSHLLDTRKLYQQGKIYNLQSIYDGLNKEYFDDKLRLYITWYGKFQQKNRSRVTFGLYHDPLKLIKINRMLDDSSVPDYLISYVIYHEMLHNVCPAYVDEKGLNRIHSKEFKEREVQFRYFDLAQNWIKQNQANLFAVA